MDSKGFKYDIGDDVWVVKKGWPLLRAWVRVQIHERTAEHEAYYYEVQKHEGGDYIKLDAKDIKSADNPSDVLFAIHRVGEPL
jgi:hypothetical protein